MKNNDIFLMIFSYLHVSLNPDSIMSRILKKNKINKNDTQIWIEMLLTGMREIKYLESEVTCMYI